MITIKVTIKDNENGVVVDLDKKGTDATKEEAMLGYMVVNTLKTVLNMMAAKDVTGADITLN